ncbi:MAG TPA: Xaa-Pro peptidase family protein [Acidimicrobiales bacterium]|nr:Xaa-Pro peptidase family protein [Acidimicrobiales bacterium]
MTTVDDRAISLARRSRFARVREEMDRQAIDALLLSLGADLPWLSGYEAMPLERPTVLVVPRNGLATLVVPRLEAPRVRVDDDLFRLRPWNEGENPVGIIAGLAGDAKNVAVSDRMWASLVLSIRDELPSAGLIRASLVTGPIRAIKDELEIAMLRAAGAAADKVAEALLAGEIRLIGRSEADVSGEISQRLRDAGHSRVNFAIVGSGPNAASPHHEAGGRVIGRSETVVCDFGGTWSGGHDVGYCSDITRTVVTGPPSEELVELYGVLQEAQAKAVEAVSIGRRCEDIDRVGREVIDAAGYGEYFIHRIGHGIGIEEHEEPYIVSGNPTRLVGGHAFSVEPGIYLPGRMGARLEDIVVAHEDGTIPCNVVDHALRVVEA